MQTLVIDTNGIVKKLEQRGFSRTQAEGITEVLKELDTGSLVTKFDLEKFRAPPDLGSLSVGAIFAQGAFVAAVLQFLK